MVTIYRCEMVQQVGMCFHQETHSSFAVRHILLDARLLLSYSLSWIRPVSIIGTDMRCSTYLFACYSDPDNVLQDILSPGVGV
jgi:hypothetical protein